MGVGALYMLANTSPPSRHRRRDPLERSAEPGDHILLGPLDCADEPVLAGA
jgi:hypothetical protein